MDDQQHETALSARVYPFHPPQRGILARVGLGIAITIGAAILTAAWNNKANTADVKSQFAQIQERLARIDSLAAETNRRVRQIVCGPKVETGCR